MLAALVALAGVSVATVALLVWVPQLRAWYRDRHEARRWSSEE